MVPNMGMLKCTQWIEILDDEGNIVSKRSAAQGYTYNGVLLGEPLEIDGDPATAEFDHSLFPNGTCEVVDDELIVTPDEEPVAND